MPYLYRRSAQLLIVSLFVVLGYAAPALAATKAAAKTTDSTKQTQQSVDSVQTVAQSYTTATPLQQGLLVQLDDKDKTKKTVIPNTTKESKKLFGVVVAPNDAAVSLSGGASGQNAFVVTSGKYKVLVSSQNGAIKSGDFVSISAITGVGMKADMKVDTVLGRAVTGFDGKTSILSSAELKQSDGTKLKVNIATITVDIDISPNKNQLPSDTGVPPAIQTIAMALVGKPITLTQLIISSVIIITGLGVAASLLYGGIQTGMTAIGRNPLARKSIMRNLIQVIITGIMIFIGCLIAVYLVLKI